MKETQSFSRQGQPTTVAGVTIVCSLPGTGKTAHVLARLLAVAESWSEKRGSAIEVIAVDEVLQGPSEAAKMLGPVKLVRHNPQEPWAIFLDRILAHAAGNWIVVASEAIPEQVEFIEAVLAKLDQDPRPTVGVQAKEECSEASDGASGSARTVFAREIVAFAAPRELSIQASRTLPLLGSHLPLAEWWESIESICRQGRSDSRPALVTLPRRRPHTHLEAEGSAALSTADHSAQLATIIKRRALNDLRVLLMTMVVAAVSSMLAPGRLSSIAAWVTGLTGFCTVSLWYLQKVALPVVARASIPLKFSAEVLAQRFRLAAWLHFAPGALLAIVCLQPGAFHFQGGLRVALVTAATVMAALGIHLGSWARILRCIVDPPETRNTVSS